MTQVPSSLSSMRLDIGAGAGHFSRALDEFGMNVTGVELERGGRSVFDAMEYASVEEFSSRNAGGFTVALSNHFSPCGLDDGDDAVAAAADRYFGAVAGLLQDDGRYLCGIGSKDPGYVSQGHAMELLPILQQHFEHVEVMWAERFEEEFEKTGSLGGMVAVIICSVPRRAPQGPAARPDPAKRDPMDCDDQRP
jgi:hypothetical protein